jgi:hypothetical protein
MTVLPRRSFPGELDGRGRGLCLDRKDYQPCNPVQSCALRSLCGVQLAVKETVTSAANHSESAVTAKNPISQKSNLP